jgi:hypothetical protein
METYRNTKPGEEPAGGQPGSVRYSVPPPGPRLEFDRWCRVLTAELRRLLPDVGVGEQRNLMPSSPLCSIAPQTPTFAICPGFEVS